MNNSYTKKALATSLALALLLGGGAVLGGTQLVRAADPADAAVAAPPSGTADAVTRAERKDRGGKHDIHGMPIFEEAAAVLGMDKKELKAALKDKTLVQIAADKGLSETDLVAKLQAERTKQIDAAVAAGRLTGEKAEKIKKQMGEHLGLMINRKFTGEEKHAKHHGGKHAMLPAPEKLAGILGITEDELKAQLGAGKSLTEIAAAKGISKEQLVAKIKEEITPWIEKMVDRKHPADGQKKKAE
ncbi:MULTISPECIES: hypothetical protein [Paenibacillus]|uniref:hypothetical protein n=1 Tax=Paenibacillus TaxID=44249 RepID=UPI0022B8B860|nr:hypothetical protein [Paenibacillus caseinilyticus]MCZ8518935.1 hypothetical protein [Paenibacillus caseinilyticus]